MTYKTTVTVYKSGNSKVITIPAGLDIEVGEELELTAKGKQVVELRRKKKAIEIDEKIEKYAGMWSGEMGEQIEKHAKEFRKNFKFFKDS